MRLAVAVAVLLLALVAAGCGSEDEASSAAEWADSFCTATQDWMNELERIGEDLSDLSTLSSETIDRAVEEARDATDTYVDDVRELGAPETESGDEIESSLENLADEVEAEKEEAEQALEDAEGEGLPGLAAAGREIAASVSAMFAALQGTFAALEQADVDGELETALEGSTACDELRS